MLGPLIVFGDNMFAGSAGPGMAVAGVAGTRL